MEAMGSPVKVEMNTVRFLWQAPGSVPAPEQTSAAPGQLA